MLMKECLVIQFILFSYGLFSQSNTLYFIENNQLIKTIHSKDSLDALRTIDAYRRDLIAKGYIENTQDSIIKKDSTLHVYLNKGRRYYWKEVLPDTNLGQAIGISFPKELTIHSIESYFDKCLTYFENNGYPFASISLANIKIEDSLLYARIKIDKNNFYVIDSIDIKGETKTSDHIIYKIVSLQPGMVYNEEILKSVKNKLATCSYLEFIREPEVSFTPDGKCLATLFVRDYNSNQFDGLIGINPDENTGKIVVTGDLNFSLLNMFKRAETIVLDWKKTKINTQNYHLLTQIPFLFKTRFGFLGELTSYREDTNFSRLTSTLGFSYFADFSQNISIYISNISSTKLSKGIAINDYPSVNSSSVNSYGLSYRINKLNSIFNPSKGISTRLSIEVGNKKLKIDDKNTNDTYIMLKPITSQYRFEGELKWFFPIKNKSTILLGVRGGSIMNDQIFENELYLLGGLKSIRGFNEQSLNASSYSIGTLEYRFLLDKLSSFFVFTDIAYIEKKTNQYSSDIPYGFGFGINLGSKAGVFSLAYGLGSQQNNPILVKNGKIHFGYTSRF